MKVFGIKIGKVEVSLWMNWQTCLFGFEFNEFLHLRLCCWIYFWFARLVIHVPKDPYSSESV